MSLDRIHDRCARLTLIPQAAIENIGARSDELDRLLRSDRHLTAGVALRVAWLQKQSIDQTKLRSLKSIVYECKGLVKSAESAGSGGVSSAALTLKCRELDAARRIWAGLAHEEQQWSMVKQRLRRYEDVVTTKELRDAMQAITI